MFRFATKGGAHFGATADFAGFSYANLTFFALASSVAVWMTLKSVIGIRVPKDDELVGLDISEMKMEAYPADPTASAMPMPLPVPAMAPVAAEVPGAVGDEA